MIAEAIPALPTHLKNLHQTQVSLQKFRISLSNRVSALDRGVDEAEGTIPEVYAFLSETAADMENRLDKEIAVEVKNWPVWDYWLKHVKGIGPSLAGQMLALLLPPLVDRGPSTWYKAAGLAPSEYQGQMRLPRPRTGGGKITYHPWLRRCLFNVATSFVRGGGYYREVYDQAKARLQEAHAGDENWAPHRIDAVARWKTVKLFLSHLWEKWLESQGKTGRRAYVVDQLKHHYIAPPEPNGEGKL